MKRFIDFKIQKQYNHIGDDMERLKNIAVSEVLSAGRVYSPKGRLDKMDRRVCYGISFCREGQITYIHNGRKYVSDSKHAVILPEGASYTITGDKTGTFPIINFTCSNKLTDEFLVYPVEDIDGIMGDFELIERMMLFSENRVKIMSVFYSLIDKLIDNDTLCGAIAPAVRYIKKNYKDQGITVGLLAGECNVSEVYLRKLFVKHLKMTPKQYLQNIRLQRAKQILSEGRVKMGDVSEQCGFQSSYNFSRFFKEKMGLTPTEYASAKGHRP